MLGVELLLRLLELAARLLLFIFSGNLRAFNSSKLRSSGGCIIFEVTPLVLVTTCDLGASPPALALLVVGAVMLGLFVVGGALIVALLQKSIKRINSLSGSSYLQDYVHIYFTYMQGT